MADAATPDWDEPPDITQQTVAYVARGMRMFWHLIATERKVILIAVGLLATVEALALCFPLLVRALVDRLPSVMVQGITVDIILLVVALFAARTVMLVIRRFMQEPIFISALIRLENLWPRMALEKLLALSLRYHERENTGRKIAKVNKGVEKLVGMLDALFYTLMPALLYTLFNLVVMFVLDWRLALLFSLPIVPAMWINLKSYERFYTDWIHWESLKEQSIGRLCQAILNVRTVQSFVRERAEAQSHRDLREAMRVLDTNICLRLQRYHFAMEMVIGLPFIVTILVGLYFVYLGWSTIGTVSYICITGFVSLQSLWSMVQVYTRVLRDLVAAERLYTLLNEEVDVANEAPMVVPEQGSGEIALRDVSVIYSGKTQAALDALSLTIHPGEMLALVGRSGSGKSTLANVLARVYDPTSGTVMINGVNVRTIDRDWYRRHFAFVPQDIDIFDGTIRDNIVYAYPEAVEEWVRQAVEAACLDTFVYDRARFPDGLDTQVGERGVKLSGGEKQRVGIARAYVALLAGAQVLVLDEATASLDSVSERVVQDFIERLRAERRDLIIVAIAHRLSTIYKADRICVLASGRVVEDGTHEQLLRRNGLYAGLVALQQMGELRD